MDPRGLVGTNGGTPHTVEVSSRNGEMAIRPAGPPARPFYFILSLIIAGVIAAGFSRTVSPRLIHPPSPRPVILYVHAALFTGWIILFMI